MRAQLLHLSGPSRGRTVTYAVPLVTIGSDPTSTAWLPAATVAPAHARIEWVQEECAFHLNAVDGRVFVNGNEVEEVILRDEDQIEFGVDGPRARFHVYAPRGSVCKPVRRMIADARAVARASGRAAGTGALTRDLIVHSTWRLRIGLLLAAWAAVVVAFFAGWFGSWLGNRPGVEALQRTADMIKRAEVDGMRELLEEQRAKIDALSAVSESLRRIQREWTRGVCLVHGAYRLRMPDDSWFTLDGGQPFEPEYTGSGFLATAEGHIVTNRHVVAPWEHMAPLQPLLEVGMRPEFSRLTVTFPGHGSVEVPFDSIRTRSDGLDVAVVRVDPKELEGVPVLPLEEPLVAGAPPRNYERAIVVGYPTGLDNLLVLAGEELVEQLQKRHATMREAIDALAAAGKVKPLITQGGVSNVEERMLVYDALTTYGGSGGPVFGDRGRVIAVNYGILESFPGSNYGVPIRFARELLPK